MFKYLLGCCLLALSNFSFAEQQTWYFVRHFEKQLGDNPSLTETGSARAAALAVFFSDKPLKHVYSTDYYRTLETAAPVTALKNLSMQLYNPRNLAEFAAHITPLDQVLVVGHSNTTPQILRLMGGEDTYIEEGDFGVIYRLQKHDDIYTTQITSITLD
jgi:broad specificity phosphatase PhoE